MGTVDEGAAPRRDDGTIDLNGLARELLEGVVNAVMDEQAAELCGDGNSRNGYRERGLDTSVGRIVPRIPRLREGTYFPDDVVERWSGTDTALAGATCEMWVNGVSNRKVDRIASELGVTSMSRSRVSRMCASLDGQVAELRGCDLSATTWPYPWLDATYAPCREAGAARSEAVVTAVAASSDGVRHVVGIACVDTESYVSWRGFLPSLRARGLAGVRLVVPDAHEGLVRAMREVLVGATRQRCITHLERNVADRCRRRGDGAAAAAAPRAAFGESDPALVRAGYERAAELLVRVDPAGADLPADAEADALAYLDFPRRHRVWVRTNNVRERMNAEIKRRTRVVQVFPSVDSLVRLVGAVCCEQNDEWAVATSFIDRRSLGDPTSGHDAHVEPEPGELARVLRLVGEAFDGKRRAA